MAVHKSKCISNQRINTCCPFIVCGGFWWQDFKPSKSRATILYLFSIVSLRCWQTFFVKIKIVSILGFAGQTVSVAATQFCCCSVKVAIDNVRTMWYGYVPAKLYLQKQAMAAFGSWAVCSLQTLTCEKVFHIHRLYLVRVIVTFALGRICPNTSHSECSCLFHRA